MSNIDKEFNKRFQYKKSESDEVEIENLWNAIESEMDEDSKIGGFYYFQRGIGVLLLALLFGFIGFWMYQSEEQHTDASIILTEEVKQTEKTEKKTVLPITKNAVPFTDKESKSISKTIMPKVTKKKELANKQELLILETKKEIKLNSQNTFSKANYNGQLKSNKTILSQPAVEQVDNELENITSTSNPVDLSTIQVLNPKRKEGTIQKESSMSPVILELLETKEFTVKSNALTAEPNFKTLIQQEDSKEQAENKDSINKREKLDFVFGVNGGVNWNNPNFELSNNSVFSDLKNSTEKGDFGQSYGVDISMILKDRWIFRSGVEYHEFWTKFEYTDSQSEQVFRENQLTKIWLNGMDTLKLEYSDVMLNQTTTRNVVHHNRYTQISIPFEIGIQNSKNKFNYGLTVGASLNFLLNQSGKTLEEVAGIVEYNDNLDNNPLSDFKIGLRISPFVGYHLSEKVMLNFSPTLQFQSHDGTSQQNLSTNISQLGFRFGVQVKL